MFSRKLPLNKHRKIRFSLSLLAVLCPALQAVELEQLHLPRSYLRYLPQLYDGAQLMEQTEKCARFISGTLNIDASEETAPVFSYTCRDTNELTYRWKVDGNSLDILDDTRPEGRISFAAYQAELERQRQLEREREIARQEEVARLQAQREAIEAEREKLRMERERAAYWPRCKALLAEQTRNMKQVQWLFDQQPEAELLPVEQSEQVAVRFTMDFNAQDYYRQPLEYRAYCEFVPPAEPVIEIHPRKLINK
ncbi:hypothetical protein [Gilvimarinus sp. DA14]|uniref:hypothetical protein n=1 Tax=Gilvimarinus sp. DA14 TaxID=2956798 RepID=UPI0020B8F44B|nr:hypothetical protein [Gilvimarinus sp. DA14]UTF59627.1 hypothetical protein NHM04_14265 [Gilvimarinus sp. DA14]